MIRIGSNSIGKQLLLDSMGSFHRIQLTGAQTRALLLGSRSVFVSPASSPAAFARLFATTPSDKPKSNETVVIKPAEEGIMHTKVPIPPPIRKFSLMRFLCKGTFFLVFLMIAGGFCLVQYSRHLYSPDYSLVFYGEPASFDAEVEKSVEFPVAQVMPKFLEAIAKSLVKRTAGSGTVDPEGVATEIIERYPHSMLGYLLLAYVNLLIGNDARMRRFVAQAKEMAEQYPEVNKHFVWLLPTQDELDRKPFKEQFIERVQDSVWTLCAPYQNDPRSCAMELTSGIIRLRNGTLCIMNPTMFSPESVKKINELGKVSMIINVTNAHDVCVKIAHEKWPEAELVASCGPENIMPTNLLPWSKFLKTKTSEEVLPPELKPFLISGRIGDEVLIYHPESKTLFGPTDFALANHAPSWGLRMYTFGLGVYRGPIYTKPVEYQSYHHFMSLDENMQRESLSKLAGLEVDRLILGHYGYWEGKEANDILAEIINHEIPHPTFLRRVGWATSVGLPSLFTQGMYSWTHRIFFGTSSTLDGSSSSSSTSSSAGASASASSSTSSRT